MLRARPESFFWPEGPVGAELRPQGRSPGQGADLGPFYAPFACPVRARQRAPSRSLRGAARVGHKRNKVTPLGLSSLLELLAGRHREAWQTLVWRHSAVGGGRGAVLGEIPLVFPCTWTDGVGRLNVKRGPLLRPGLVAAFPTSSRGSFGHFDLPDLPRRRRGAAGG